MSIRKDGQRPTPSLDATLFGATDDGTPAADDIGLTNQADVSDLVESGHAEGLELVSEARLGNATPDQASLDDVDALASETAKSDDEEEAGLDLPGEIGVSSDSDDMLLSRGEFGQDQLTQTSLFGFAVETVDLIHHDLEFSYSVQATFSAVSSRVSAVRETEKPDLYTDNQFAASHAQHPDDCDCQQCCNHDHGHQDGEQHPHSFYADAAAAAADNHEDEFTANGGKWGASGALGTSGGTVTWSMAGAGVTAVDSGFFSGSSVTFSSFLSYSATSIIELAFSSWSAIANIDFLQVADGGGRVGIDTSADIRVMGAYIDGNFGVLGRAYLPVSGGDAAQTAFSGDVVIDSGDSALWTNVEAFFLTVMHEIGHAIGLSHETSNIALMNPTLNLNLLGLPQDDVNGAQAIYGARGTDDYDAATTTTGTLAVGGTATGTINSLIDTDWFRITLNAGDTYVFEGRGSATGNGTLADPVIGIHNSAGVLISFDDDGGTGANSRLSYTATSSGTYYVGVTTADATVGTYQLVANGPAVIVDDHGGSPSTKSALILNDVSASGNIETGSDQDWFLVTLISGVTYTFEAWGASTGQGTLSNPYLQLMDVFGNSLAADDNSGTGTNAFITYTATYGGIYFVNASSVGSATGTYLVSGSTVPVGPGDDHGGSIATTSTLTADAGNASGNIETGSDQDWFRITLTSGVTYTIEMNGGSSGAGTLSNPYLQLMNASGIAIASNDDGGAGANALITYTATTSGTYYVNASSVGSATGTYAVSVSTAIGGDDYGNDGSTNGRLVIDDPALVGRIEEVGDEDWFEVSLVGGKTYEITVSGGASAGQLSDAYLRLIRGSTQFSYDDNGGTGNDAKLIFTAFFSSTYYVSAQSADGGVGQYAVRVVELADVDHVPGSTTSQVAIPTVGAQQTGTIDTVGDQDWYRIELEAGETYSFRLTGAGSGVGITLDDPFLQVFDASGMQLASYDHVGGGVPSALNFTATATGTYFVGVSDVSNGTGTYSLTTTTLAPVTVTQNGATRIYDTLAEAASNTNGRAIYTVDGDRYSAAAETVVVDEDGATIILPTGISRPTVRISEDAGATTSVRTTGSGDSNIFGNSSNNTIYGNSGKNLLVGGDGVDTLYGESGQDALYGGIGADILRGGTGNDSLYGEIGVDHMYGGDGSDAYFIDNPFDQIYENAGEGTNDTIYTTVNYSARDNIEVINALGTENLLLYGNEIANTMFGNDGNNLLNGLGGIDGLLGGLGNDTYVVDNSFDQIIEHADAGTDIVHSAVSYALGENLELLYITGAAIQAIGNSVVNTIVGNDQNNGIDGRGGADVMTGNGGLDTFVFRAGETHGDVIQDFDGNGAGAGDVLMFRDFGAGATVSQVTSRVYSINYNGGASSELFTLANEATLHDSDYFFV